MKRIYSIIALIAAVAMFTACGSDDASYKATPTLDIASADVLFEAEGGDGYITANTTSELTATTESNWVTLTVTGNVVTVTADPNITLDGRSAVIKLSAGGTETTVTATQKASIYGVQSLEYEIGDYQASLDIPVVHNQEVTVESNDEWLTAVWNEETNQIEIVAEDNDEIDPRVGSVTITMGDYSDEITITQKGFLLNVKEEQVVSKKNAALDGYAVDVEHSRTVSVATDDDWIVASFDADNDQVVINAAANEEGGAVRIGHVTVTSGPVTKVISIIQYDFVTELQNLYILYYKSSATASNWSGVTSMISYNEKDNTGTLLFMFNNSSDYIYSIPLVVNPEDETLQAGPCSSFVGAYDTYNIYLVYRSTAGYWSGYNNFTSMSDGIFEIEEDEEGNPLVTIIWGGVFGNQNIDAWAFRAMKNSGDFNGEFVADNNGGYLASYYFPQMEKYVYDESGSGAKPALFNAVK